jgi:hypothetical protein
MAPCTAGHKVLEAFTLSLGPENNIQVLSRFWTNFRPLFPRKFFKGYPWLPKVSPWSTLYSRWAATPETASKGHVGGCHPQGGPPAAILLPPWTPHDLRLCLQCLLQLSCEGVFQVEKHQVDAVRVAHEMVVEDPVGFVAGKLPDGELAGMTCGAKERYGRVTNRTTDAMRINHENGCRRSSRVRSRKTPRRETGRGDLWGKEK